MSSRNYFVAAFAVLLLASISSTNAALTPIDVTWNPAGAGISTQGPFTFDDVVLNTYSTIDITGNNFAEQGYLRLSVFTNNGVPVAVPAAGFPGGTPYSLYISFSATGTQQSVIPGLPAPAFGQFTTANFSLLGAPGMTSFLDSNNDGVFEVNGAAPVTLATGSLLSPGSTALTVDQVTGLLLPAAQLTASFNPNAAVAPFFVSPSAATGLAVTASATNTGTVTTQLPLPNGVRLVINGGGGNVTLALPTVAPIPEPDTYALLIAGAGLLGFVARRRRK